jgi:hypothetical protein|tara:strand:+ start:729 stop:1103 length:375 start_codon:yes stop_codon:yes gene_type:complete
MIKLRRLIKESTWDRKFGEPLPTLEDTMNQYNGEVLTEKKELGGALINKIERLTDVNNHNEARLVLAKEMKLRILVKGYESLIVLHTIFNQMNELMHARHKLDKTLFAQAKRVYSDYDQIYSAF